MYVRKNKGDLKVQVINATENQQCEKEIKKDSGLQCLITIAAYYGIPADVENIRHNFSLDDIIAGENDILRVAKKIKLKSRINKINRYSLPKMTLPAILVTNDSEFIIAAKADNDKVLIMFPFDNAPKIMTYDELESIWTGRIILFIPRSRTNQDIKFGFKWFIPSIIKYKKPLLEVILSCPYFSDSFLIDYTENAM